VNRERWTSFPAAPDEEHGLVGALSGATARRELHVAAEDGTERLPGATPTLEAEAPLDGKASVVARLTLDGGSLGEGEALVEDAWALLDAFLADAGARARADGSR
jgi:hypothetical protein